MNNTRPFLKWAGGKRQLIPELLARLPQEIIDSKTIDNYIEPFIGGGSFFFYLKNNFNIKTAYISDINYDLILAYTIIQEDIVSLCKILEKIEKQYLKLSDDDRQKFFYEARTGFNSNKSQKQDFQNNVQRVAQLIFLNKTCFNGLYRQNKKGEFNVPYGRYKNPTIYDEENLYNVHLVLQNVTIQQGDFELSEKFATKNSLIYLDPPYRPINLTSSFTSYSKEDFGDDDQIRLANYYKKLSKKGCNIILSNSDPKNINIHDNFFENLYKKFTISKVVASRSINSNAKGRGKIKELMITNF